MKLQPLHGLCAAFALAAASAALAQDKPMTVNLSAQNRSGESGTATFTPQGDKTQVMIKLTGAPDSTPQPAHIHDGSCAKLDPKPRIPLQNVVGGMSTTTLDMKLSDVVGKGGAINVHKSGSDLSTYVACGDVKSK
jgi:hypothetical protein